MRKHPLLALVTAVSTATFGLLGAVGAGAITTTGNKATTSVHVTHRHHKAHPRTTRAERRRLAAKRLAARRLAAKRLEAKRLAAKRLEAKRLAAKVVKKAVPLVVKHAVATTQHAFVPMGGVWAQLRACESGGDYQENTGNGYYGAYQFSLGTWRSLGAPGIPSAATPAVQDSMALKLQTRSGWQPWPHCSVELHLA